MLVPGHQLEEAETKFRPYDPPSEGNEGAKKVSNGVFFYLRVFCLCISALTSFFPSLPGPLGSLPNVTTAGGRRRKARSTFR